MASSLFSRNQKVENYKAIPNEKKQPVADFSIPTITDEKDLSNFIEQTLTLISGMEKNPVNAETMFALLSKGNVNLILDGDFCTWISKRIDAPEEKVVEDFLTNIKTLGQFTDFERYSSMDYQNFKKSCDLVFTVAKQFPVVSDLLDARTKCFEMLRSINTGLLKLDSIASHKYQTSLVALINVIDALPVIKISYTPPAELVFSLSKGA